jgi:hypothetical protein
LKFTSLLVAGIVALCVGFVPGVNLAHAESTMNCPAGTYDMLDWMTLDSDLRANNHMVGSSNPLYSSIGSGKFYWTKGGNGFPWDIQLYDNSNIYLWITEYGWGNPTSFKKFAGTNLPLTKRCAQGGYPGTTLTTSNTTYQAYTSCNHYTTHNLQNSVNQVWGPYKLSFGGALPSNLPTLIISYRYNCDGAYNNCGDKEEYYLTQRYGMVQWIHYSLVKGNYEQQQKSVFNWLTGGTATPDFPCF